MRRSLNGIGPGRNGSCRRVIKNMCAAGSSYHAVHVLDKVDSGRGDGRIGSEDNDIPGKSVRTDIRIDDLTIWRGSDRVFLGGAKVAMA